MSGQRDKKGEVNVQTDSVANPAYNIGGPFTGESKLKQFLYSPIGYIIAYAVTTALIVAAVYLP